MYRAVKLHRGSSVADVTRAGLLLLFGLMYTQLP